MAVKTITSYQIGLDLTQSDNTKKNIEALKSSFSDVNKSLDDINAQYQQMIKAEGEHTEEAKEYNRLLTQRLNELDKENDLLIHSASEEGKRNRERLRELKAIQEQQRAEEARRKKLTKEERKSEGDYRKLTKEELAELKRLEKSVLDLDDEQLRKRQEANKHARMQVKLISAQHNGLLREEKARRGIKQLSMDGLKRAKELLKTQLNYIKSLKTTEGRMKAMSKIKGAGAKVGKVVGGAAGIAGAFIGGALAGADNQVNQEREARRIAVSGLSQEDKLGLVRELTIKTGGDAASIVDAINRAAGVIGSSSKDDILRAARAEIEFPGASTLFASSGKDAKAEDFTILQNRLRAIQGATGANISDLSSVMNTVSNMRDSAFQSGVSQQDLISLYSALQGSGTYDSPEQIERAMRGFLAQSDLNRGNFYEKMSSFDWSKYVYGSQNKNQADNFRKNFDFKALEMANTAPTSTELVQTGAEKAAESARKISAKKDELVQRILERLDASGILDNGMIEKVIEMLFKTLNAVLPLLDPILKVLQPVLDLLDVILSKISPVINKVVKFLENPKDFIFGDGDDAKEPQPTEASGNSRAAGGIVTSPAIVGERGAEMVIPLDYARAGRANNIIQNVSQTFNMGSNSNTALSLGQAVKQRSFTNTLLNNRLFGGR